MHQTESQQTGRPPRLHTSMEQPLCPLCGVDLGIPAVPQLPCTTLTRLGRHFADDCASTRTYLGGAD